jgi:hypothetical protein
MQAAVLAPLRPGAWPRRFRQFDFGICPQTGYHDAGARFRCCECGAQGDTDEEIAACEVERTTGARRETIVAFALCGG